MREGLRLLLIYYFGDTMIKLTESSSNTFAIQPSANYANGSTFVYKFTDVFSKDEFTGTATGSKFGQWVNLPINVSTSSYIVGTNTSTLPLYGGTYNLQIFPFIDNSIQWDIDDEDWDVEATAWEASAVTISVYGTEPRKWGLMGNTWSSVPGIPTTNNNSIMTTRAWVSEGIGRDVYSSANENGAYVVYEG